MVLPQVIIVTISIIMTGYLVVGLAGYVGYPDKVTSNVLNVLPEGRAQPVIVSIL